MNTEILKAKLSKEALRAMLTFGRVAGYTGCPESHRLFGALGHRVMMNLMRHGAAEYHDSHAVRLTDVGLALAIEMKDEPHERYAVRRRWYRKPSFVA